jgi:hypothetical protein
MIRSTLRSKASIFVARRSFATASLSFTHPAVVRPSPSEVNEGRLDARNLEAAVRHLHQDGLVVVEDVISHQSLDHLNEKMVRDARILQGRGKNSPYNYNPGNLQQDAPPVLEFFDLSIFASTPAHIYRTLD